MRRGAAIIAIPLAVVLAGTASGSAARTSGSAARPSGSAAGPRAGQVRLRQDAPSWRKMSESQPAAPFSGHRRPAALASSAGCRLTIRYEGPTSGTGDVFAYFLIRNRGRAACRLRRYPLVTLIGPDGRPLTAYESRTDLFGGPVRPVPTLAPGPRAHFLIVFRPLTPGGGRRCAPAAVTALIRPTLTGTSTARATLPTHLAKLHEPVNPCPRATFSVTRVTAGL